MTEIVLAAVCRQASSLVKSKEFIMVFFWPIPWKERQCRELGRLICPEAEILDFMPIWLQIHLSNPTIIQGLAFVFSSKQQPPLPTKHLIYHNGHPKMNVFSKIQWCKLMIIITTKKYEFQISILEKILTETLITSLLAIDPDAQTEYCMPYPPRNRSSYSQDRNRPRLERIVASHGYEILSLAKKFPSCLEIFQIIQEIS